MKVAVVGATGLVGTKMLEVLTERNFPVSELIPVASERSEGKKINFKGTDWNVVTPAKAIALRPDVAIFSAGGSTSLEWAPKFAEIGCVVIDNSSAWRMDPTKKLVVPEVNGDVLTATDKIIANPNCSTIQLVMVLKPIHEKYGIKRVVVSTYQSVTGTGKKAVDQLFGEIKGIDTEKAYPYPIHLNVIPQIDVFSDDNYTKEELKMMKETNKIMADDHIRVTATAVRIPVMGGHSESVNLELNTPFEVADIKAMLGNQSGIIVTDEPEKLAYPMPLHSHNKDEVFVGRIRRDHTIENGLNLWIVADNLRKGAATNAVQIAEHLIEKGYLIA